MYGFVILIVVLLLGCFCR